MFGIRRATKEFCATLREISDENSRLMAENAKLREQGERLFDKTLELSTENDRLRELLQRTWNVFHDATGREFDAVKRDLREFGVEVNEMGRRKRFTDAAGYTRHCWECVHAKDWRKETNVIGDDIADCELTGRVVRKYASPNNPCSLIPKECDYEEVCS